MRHGPGRYRRFEIPWEVWFSPESHSWTLFGMLLRMIVREAAKRGLPTDAILINHPNALTKTEEAGMLSYSGLAIYLVPEP